MLDSCNAYVNDMKYIIKKSDLITSKALYNNLLIILKVWLHPLQRANMKSPVS